MLKVELRKIYLEKRNSLAPSEKSERSRRIADRFFEHFDLRAVNFLHCFLPLERFGEIDTRLIFERVWREFPRVETLAPRVNFGSGEIENLKFTAETASAPNRWHIPEPASGATVETNRIDMILVPLLCFDRRGFRVGYGKGFYDRLLKNCGADCPKIGLSFFPSTAEIADAHDADVPLDFCVTPEEIFNIKTQGTQSF